MKNKYLLDSFALLAYLKQENNYKKIRDLLSSDKSDIVMNDINIGEVYYIIARERGMDKAQYFLDIILPSLPITNVSNTISKVIDAAKIKAKYPISYADSFAVSTAHRLKAVIITGDPEFKLVENIVNIEWI
ncbi:MAG: type II toxin-antitoxin system VapC family toxin [Candidatus Anammoxibacter sp.]